MNTEPTVNFPTELCSRPPFGLFVAPQADSSAVPEVELPVSAEFVDAFADATGWVIGFEETGASLRNRVANGSRQPTGGTLKIIDMCPAWSAETPTAHRAKCDRVVAVLNEMVFFHEE